MLLLGQSCCWTWSLLFRVLVVTLAFASLHTHTRDAAPSNSPRCCERALTGLSVASPVIRNPAAEQGNMWGHRCTMSAKTRPNAPFSTIAQAKPQQALAPLRPSVVIALLTPWHSLLKDVQHNEASWSEMPKLRRARPTK